MKAIFQGLQILLKPLLYPLSLLYGFIAWLRNKVYDKGVFNSITFSVPVISVGNLSTGGTGKTPHIEYLIRLLQYEYCVATMSRGYRRRTKGFVLADKEATVATIGDEPMQFFTKFPEVVVSVCEDRMAGIPQLLLDHSEVEIVLLDDAFQHRSVKPGLNILLMDFQKPFYKDYILPFGRLRESRAGYKRADVIIVTKCPENLSPKNQQKIIEKIRPLSNQAVFFSRIKYLPFWDFFTGADTSMPADAHLVLVSGIARPEPMLDYLRHLAEYVHLLPYPDHHYFSTGDLDEMKATISDWAVENKGFVVSEKDAVRLVEFRQKMAEWNVPVYVLPIEIAFLKKGEQFDQIVKDYVEKEREEDWFD